MRLYLGEVKKGVGRTFKDVISENLGELEWEGEKILFAQPVQIEVMLTNCDSEILVEGTLTTGLVLNCSRCLEPFLYPMKVGFTLELRNVDRLNRPSDLEAEAEETDELKYFCEDDNSIDITKDVEELILVNLPMKPLCKRECLGICPVCGTNRNQRECTCEREAIDPRLEILRTWKSL
ncbi:MAG: YceD family protein [Candidatus Caldatribacteriaceae bacterium]